MKRGFSMGGWVLLLAGWLLAAHAGEADQVGEAPRFRGPLVGGGQFDLAHQKGKAVMVSFWATWCPVCRRELPEWDRFYRSYRGKGFEWVAVSIDDRESDVSQFMRKHGYGFPAAWRMHDQTDDNFPLAQLTPTIYLIDRDGRIAFKKVGALPLPKLKEQVDRLLGSP